MPSHISSLTCTGTTKGGEAPRERRCTHLQKLKPTTSSRNHPPPYIYITHALTPFHCVCVQHKLSSTRTLISTNSPRLVSPTAHLNEERARLDEHTYLPINYEGLRGTVPLQENMRTPHRKAPALLTPPGTLLWIRSLFEAPRVHCPLQGYAQT